MSPLITTVAPLAALLRSVAGSPRARSSHCEYSRSATMLRIFTSPGVHSALVRAIRRQPLSFASSSSAREVLHRVRVAEEDQRAVARPGRRRGSCSSWCRRSRPGSRRSTCARAVVAGPQRVRPQRVGALPAGRLFGQRRGAFDLGERRRLKRRLQVVEQRRRRRPPIAMQASAEREGAAAAAGPASWSGGPGPRPAWWVSAVGIQEAATTASPAATESGPPERRGEDQRRPVPEVPGVGDAADVADRRAARAGRPGRALARGRRPRRRRRGSAPRRRGSGAAPPMPGKGVAASKAKPA